MGKAFRAVVWAAGMIPLVATGCDRLGGKASNDEPNAQEAPAPEAVQTAGPATVGLVHAVSDVGPITVLIDGEPLEETTKIVPFDGQPVRFSVPAGRKAVVIRDYERRTDPGANLLKKNLQLSPGQEVLLVIAGLTKPLAKGDRPVSMRLVAERGKAEAPPSSATARVIHAASNLPPTDVVLRARRGSSTKPVLFVNVGFGKGSTYQPLPAGARVVVFRSGLEPMKPPLFTSGSLTFASEGSYTLILTGESGSALRPLKLWQLSNLDPPATTPQKAAEPPKGTQR